MEPFLKFLKLVSVVGLMACLACSCVEPFEIRSINYAGTIVVEGRITDRKTGHFVKLSYTRPIDEQKNDPIEGAIVWVEASDGSRIDFNESSPGYYTCAGGISGKAGLLYQLFFVTSNDLAYQSSPQELIASPPIDSIYHVYAEEASRTSADLKKGIQFFVDTHDDLNQAHFYKYEWEETWEVSASYPSFYVFSRNPDTVLIQDFNTSPCYASSRSKSIIIGTSSGQTQNRLSEMPLRYITSDTDHLRIAYAILARQFAISREAYSFYRKIVENNENNGSLFDRQLGAVVGNITSLHNTDETVLGFFEVAGVSEKRTFVRFLDLDPRFPWPDAQFPCSSDGIVNVGSIDSVKYYSVGQGFGIISAGYRDGAISAMLGPKICTDCRFRGPAIKPDFWIY